MSCQTLELMCIAGRAHIPRKKRHDNADSEEIWAEMRSLCTEVDEESLVNVSVRREKPCQSWRAQRGGRGLRRVG